MYKLQTRLKKGECHSKNRVKKFQQIETIQAYAEDDAYCLKFYSAELDTKTLDVLKDRSIARDKLLDDLLDKGQSIDIENYDLIDFDMNRIL